MRPPRSLAVLLIAVLAALGVAATTLGAAPVKGGSYHGSLAAPRATNLVTFTVSASGKKVTKLKTSDLPLFCSGGGPPVPISFKPATISAKGTFKTTGKQVIKVGPRKGQVGATLKLTGKFGSAGKESGSVSVKYPKAPTCNGTSRYSTHT